MMRATMSSPCFMISFPLSRAIMESFLNYLGPFFPVALESKIFGLGVTLPGHLFSQILIGPYLINLLGNIINILGIKEQCGIAYLFRHLKDIGGYNRCAQNHCL